jgi:hypothetical protein
MKTDVQLRAHVMRRVYLIYWGRQIARPLPRMAAFALLALALTSSVSVASVILNALSVGGVYEVALFFVSAFVNTTLFVQAVVAEAGEGEENAEQVARDAEGVRVAPVTGTFSAPFCNDGQEW